MNFFQIIDQLAEVDPDALGRLDSRRAVFGSLGTFAKRGALAATPVLLASYFQKAYAGTSAGDPIEVFNYALTLELLENDFYDKMIASPVFAAQTPLAQAAIRKIKQHEVSHVDLLGKVIRAINGTPVTGVAFKTTAFPATWLGQLRVAQLLEDTGVRAYKGRAGDLLGLGDVNVPTVGTINPLQSALQIHSVEARHAAHIRYMRGQTAWINGDGDLDGEPNYGGAIPELTTTQSGVNLIAANIITPATTYLAKDAAASFDEVLTKSEVLALVAPLLQ